MTTLLIDADPLIYAAAHSAERVVEWEPGEFTYHAKLEDGQAIFREKLAAIIEAVPGTPLLCLSDSGHSFRRDLYPLYKAGRGRRPLLHGPLREWLLVQQGWKTYLRPRLEADDILGILATHPKLVAGEKIMVSIDKDLRQIPGYLFNPDHDSEPSFTDEASADRLFFLQTLTGDQTDNYPGCPGIGAVRAEKILGPTLDGVWSRIIAAYQKAELGEDDALVQARCARILRASDYNFKTKEPIWWTPSNP